METALNSHGIGGAGRPVAPKIRTLTFPRILVHLGLLAATAVTTTFMGTLLAVDAPPLPDDVGLVPALLALLQAAASSPRYLASGLIFSFTLLVILGAHELGHYFACRYYRIDASLPYFIPAPPPVFTGTFGAFIKIRSNFPDRRSLFDVGVAGPIAGFCFAVPAMIVGLLFAAPTTAVVTENQVIFHDPLIFMVFQRLLGLPDVIAWNPIHFAAWIGMFATGMNLIPVGQLDGGHAIAALFGRRGHRVVSIVFFAAIAVLALVSFVRFQSPVWFLYVILLGMLAFREHPPTRVEEADIGRARKIVAAITALIFLLTFMPFPITVN